MAKIYEAHFNVDDPVGGIIEVAPPRREGRWVWGLVFAVFLIGGATLGLTPATGSFSNAVQVAQNFGSDGTSETAAN